MRRTKLFLLITFVTLFESQVFPPQENWALFCMERGKICLGIMPKTAH